MKTSAFCLALAVGVLQAPAVQAATLDDVRARGSLSCGLSAGVTGFSAGTDSEWHGFDADFCKALAAAVLGDQTLVQFVPLADESRFQALSQGQVDLLVGAPGPALSTAMALNLVATSYYDGQGFMVRQDLGVSSAKELNSATVCLIDSGATRENLALFMTENNMVHLPMVIPGADQALQLVADGTCAGFTADVSRLASLRATLTDPGSFVILPETISKEPLGPMVRQGDEAWGDVVRWTFLALVAAEEMEITKANIDEVAIATSNPEVRRLLGLQGEIGTALGLDPAWARNAIAANGNYGEIFEANIGMATPIKLARGLNALWTQGGLQYAPPFRQ